MQIKKDLLNKKFQFWDEFIRKWEKTAEEGVVAGNIQNKDEL